MQALEKTYRNRLEQTIKSARKVAETASRAALEQLGVGEAKPFPHLSESERILRRQLRAHGRQRGDVRDSRTEVQGIDRLVEETAYEHWHQMLFARFLAENGLLMYWPSGAKDPIDIPLDTCQELIDEGAEKAKSKWELAARFAARMLPQIFRPDSPVLHITLAPEHQQSLESLLAQLPQEVFIASDSLGWVYQFWQADKKDEVNASGVKIGANELPSVTQLFTEDYMVDFLLDNTLGAWHAGKVLAVDSKLAERAQNEDELRSAVALSGATWKFLRFSKSKDGKWRPAAGTFDGWQKTARELKCLDPSMGSGHFVVGMFERMAALRMAEEKLDEKSAMAAVIRDNLFGLEIDPRCTQIGAFSLAFVAWRRAGYFQLPTMNLACSGLAPNAKKDDWIKLSETNPNHRFAMGALYELFQKAPILGSLINPSKDRAVTYSSSLQELQPLLVQALQREKADDVHELAVTAQGIAKAAEILAGQFTLVATNVPYLGRGKQSEILMDYCENAYPEAKADLATCFIERGLEFCGSAGSVALVTPQTWFFQAGYKNLRKNLLTKTNWDFVARLGEHGFDSPQAAGAFTALFSISRRSPEPLSKFFGIDASSENSPGGKAKYLFGELLMTVGQLQQLENPDARIVLESVGSSTRLSEYAISVEGLSTGDSDRYLSLFWEIISFGKIWEGFQRSPDTDADYCGARALVRWEDGKGTLAASPEARIQGHGAWGKLGVLVNMMRHLNVCLSVGAKHDKITAVIVPKKDSLLLPIWTFCSSGEFHNEVRKLNPALQPGTGTLVKVPFDLAHWQNVAAEKYPHGLPKPFSSDPTQWLFSGHPKGADQPLHVAVARLIGYQWPRQTGSSYPNCPALGPDGLEKLADADGIVCIPPVRGEASAADRLLDLLVAAYGKEWSANVLSKLLASCDHVGRPIETWLRDKFFLQHCKLFHHRPFIWHVWDGLHDGFAALVNYHKLDRKNLEALIYTYLGDWITRQKSDVKNGVDGAQVKLAAAEELKKKLEAILEGEAPFDIFVRWKSIEKQPIGWEPDINDGVRMNIRPFMTAGVLRFNKKPQINIAWEKDRGQDITSAPWYKVFGGERINDHHLSLKDKKSAREKK